MESSKSTRDNLRITYLLVCRLKISTIHNVIHRKNKRIRYMVLDYYSYADITGVDPHSEIRLLSKPLIK